MEAKQWIWFALAVTSAVIMTNCVLFSVVEAFQSHWKNALIILSVGAASLTFLRISFEKTKFTA